MRLFAATLLASVATATSGQLPQSDNAFKEAIQHDGSSSPRFVMITVVDGNTKSERVRCVTTHALIGAIHRELRLEYDDTGRRDSVKFALSAPSHRFAFYNKLALRNVNYFDAADKIGREACRIIAKGHVAFAPDLIGGVVDGTENNE
jgi:hypothetical protein